MEQPWWVYGSIALGCAFFYLLIKVVESKLVKEDDSLGIFSFVVGLIGFFAAYQAADALKLFG